MRTLLNAFNLLLLLALVLAAVHISSQDAGHLNIIWQGYEMETTAAVGMVGLMIVLALAFYLGQFVSWLTRLPTIIRGWFRPAPPKRELPRLVEALALASVGDDKTARSLLEKANPRADEELLEAYARIRLAMADPVELERWADDTHLGAYVALSKAQQAAALGNWQLVHAITSPALERFGKMPALQILQLKSLLNGRDPAAAVGYLPSLRSHIPVPLWPLLEMAVRGPTTTTAAELDNPWFKNFSNWLATDDTTLPPPPVSHAGKTSKKR